MVIWIHNMFAILAAILNFIFSKYLANFLEPNRQHVFTTSIRKIITIRAEKKK